MSPSIINSFSVVLKVHILFSSKCKHPAWGWGSSSGLKPEEEKKTQKNLKMLQPFPVWELREEENKESFQTERGVHCLFLCLTACVIDALGTSRQPSTEKRQHWLFVLKQPLCSYVYLTRDLLCLYELWFFCHTRKEGSSVTFLLCSKPFRLEIAPQSMWHQHLPTIR